MAPPPPKGSGSNGAAAAAAAAAAAPVIQLRLSTRAAERLGACVGGKGKDKGAGGLLSAVMDESGGEYVGSWGGGGVDMYVHTHTPLPDR